MLLAKKKYRPPFLGSSRGRNLIRSIQRSAMTKKKSKPISFVNLPDFDVASSGLLDSSSSSPPRVAGATLFTFGSLDPVQGSFNLVSGAPSSLVCCPISVSQSSLRSVSPPVVEVPHRLDIGGSASSAPVGSRFSADGFRSVTVGSVPVVVGSTSGFPSATVASASTAVRSASASARSLPGLQSSVVVSTPAVVGPATIGSVLVPDSTQPATVPAAPPVKNYAELLKSSAQLQELGTPVEHVSGAPFVLIPDENIEAAKLEFKDFIYARFHGDYPSMGKIIGVVNAVWARTGPKIFVHNIGEGMYLLRVTNPRTRETLLSRTCWNIGGLPMFVAPWTSDFSPDEPPLTSAVVPVELRNVPYLLFNQESLSRLATAIGKPDCLAPETERKENFEVAKIYVRVDLTSPLPSKIISGFSNGREVEIDVSYPWLPSKCVLCKKFGHVEAKCPNRINGASDHLGVKNQSLDNPRRRSRSRPGRSTEKKLKQGTLCYVPVRKPSDDEGLGIAPSDDPATESAHVPSPSSSAPLPVQPSDLEEGEIAQHHLVETESSSPTATGNVPEQNQLVDYSLLSTSVGLEVSSERFDPVSSSVPTAVVDQRAIDIEESSLSAPSVLPVVGAANTVGGEDPVPSVVALPLLGTECAPSNGNAFGIPPTDVEIVNQVTPSDEVIVNKVTPSSEESEESEEYIDSAPSTLMDREGVITDTPPLEAAGGGEPFYLVKNRGSGRKAANH